MKKIIVLLCLGLIGCSTVPSRNKVLSTTSEKTKVVLNSEAVVNAPVNQNEMDDIITIFSKAIKNNPNYAGAYYNRAAAYFHKNEYDKSWQDIHKAEELGINVDDKFIELVNKLKKASGRDK